MSSERHQVVLYQSESDNQCFYLFRIFTAQGLPLGVTCLPANICIAGQIFKIKLRVTLHLIQERILHLDPMTAHQQASVCRSYLLVHIQVSRPQYRRLHRVSFQLYCTAFPSHGRKSSVGSTHLQIPLICGKYAGALASHGPDSLCHSSKQTCTETLPKVSQCSRCSTHYKSFQSSSPSFFF
jgi:hypothetical protein